jgi:hypothetical protein
MPNTSKFKEYTEKKNIFIYILMGKKKKINMLTAKKSSKVKSA